MRKTIALILALLLLLALAGCGRNDSPDHTDDWYDPDHIPEAPEQTDYIAVIRNEVFRADSVLSQAMSEKVELTLEEENEESILVSVTAPDVCAEALDWFDAVSEEEYSNEALDAQTFWDDEKDGWGERVFAGIQFSYSDSLSEELPDWLVNSYPAGDG